MDGLCVQNVQRLQVPPCFVIGHLNTKQFIWTNWKPFRQIVLWLTFSASCSCTWVLCWQLWLSLLAVSLITKKQKVPRSWSPSRTWCLRYGIPHFLETCQAVACSRLLTVLNMGFNCKRPGCGWYILAFSRQDVSCAKLLVWVTNS